MVLFHGYLYSASYQEMPSFFNTLRQRKNSHHFTDDIFKCIFLNENVWILFQISLNFVPEVWINNIPALVQIMAWCQPGDKPLSEPMMVSSPTHICITRPQWVNRKRLLFCHEQIKNLHHQETFGVLFKTQCSPIRPYSIFSQKYSQQTRHSSPMKEIKTHHYWS